MRSVFNDVHEILCLILFIKACVIWYSFDEYQQHMLL